MSIQVTSYTHGVHVQSPAHPGSLLGTSYLLSLCCGCFLVIVKMGIEIQQRDIGSILTWINPEAPGKLTVTGTILPIAITRRISLQQHKAFSVRPSLRC
jgi:hypothetical protein